MSTATPGGPLGPALPSLGPIPVGQEVPGCCGDTRELSVAGQGPGNVRVLWDVAKDTGPGLVTQRLCCQEGMP